MAQLMDNRRRKKRSRHRGKVFGAGLIVLLCIVTAVALMGTSLLKTLFGGERPEEPEQPEQSEQSEQPEQAQQPEQPVGGSQGEAPDYDSPIDFQAVTPGTVISDGALLNFTRHNFPLFQNADEIPAEYLLSFGIWEVLQSQDFAGDLTYDDSGSILLPAADVTKAFTRRFALTKDLEHQSLELFGSFTYDGEAKQYKAPVFGMEDVYMPRIQAVEQTETGVILDLDFISSKAQDAYLEGGALPEAYRKVRLTLTSTEGRFYQFTSMVLREDAPAQ